jgi:parallel beta-helix repeat protein
MSRHKTSPLRRLLMERLENRLALATFYVSNAGSNASNGSTATPWLTLQYAADHVHAGDTVIVRAGTYVGFDLQTDGTASNRITFSAEQGVLINQRNARTTDGINLEGADYVTIEGFKIAGVTRAGIRSVVNHHVIIRNNQADQNGRWGIFTGFSDDLLIEGNTCSRSGAEHGIYVSNSGDRPVIRNNVLWGNAACGIHMNGDISEGGDGIISGALVEGNIVYENGAVAGGSGINADGVQNSVFRNNLVFNNHASGISLYCIDGAAGSSNNLLINNTVVQASNGRWALNIQSGSTGNTVLNNILYNQHATRGSIDISADSLAGFRSDYNVVMNRLTTNGGDSILALAQWRSQTGQDQHSLVATPSQLFVDFAHNDYHLSATSLALNAGTSESAPATDYEGTARPSGGGIDIGADERLQSAGWGAVAFYLVGGQAATGDTSYTATATRSGTFTAEVLFAHAGGNVDLEVYDANNQLLGSSATSNNGERVDVTVTAGQQVRIRVLGVNANVTFRGTNLLTVSGDTVTIGGTATDELFVFLPGDTISRIAVNGVGYDFANSAIRHYTVQAGGGADTTVVVGSSAAETATISVGSVLVSSTNYDFSASGSEFNTLFGNGGNDAATLLDAAGNDTFTGSPTQGIMSGAGYTNTANGFETVTANFNAGGFDQAFLYGSIGDDRFEASPTAAFLQGPGFRLNTSGYDTVVGVGGWGNDIALLADGSGDETFIGQADAGSLSGNGFYLRAANFERVEARSSGGFDVAYLWDSAGDDYFGGSKVLAFLNGVGFSNYVESFDRVTGLSTGGNDTADIYGTAGSDQFSSNGRSRLIQAADYLVQTENFRNVRAYGGGGTDVALLQDLLASHTISGRANWFRLANADSVTGYDFEQVTAAARSGQRPQADVTAIDYVFTRVGF